MPKRQPRSFSREFKLKAIERLEAGESGTALSRELSVKRTILYRWREAFRRGGELVGGQGTATPDFTFATLYRLRRWREGQFRSVLAQGRFPAVKQHKSKDFSGDDYRSNRELLAFGKSAGEISSPMKSG